MSKFLNEFKEFAMRGNVLDMAVGVINRWCLWQNRKLCCR